jgi:peptidoglycan/xylan/chitin deacetylase (PgdA/CDA1 family)
MSKFVISLDFELFWGIGASRGISNYGRNVEGARIAIPAMLRLFKKYRVCASWATVGMLLCRDYRQWSEIRPSVMPTYQRSCHSAYSLGHLAKEWPKLFFARELVEAILATTGQELASHTYSHFYCGEAGATVDQFQADLECARALAAELGVQPKSLVFPRNQVLAEFVAALPGAGYKVFRGNPDHWLYRHGHRVRGGQLGRLLRAADSWIPISGPGFSRPRESQHLVDVPATQFLRPMLPALGRIEQLRLRRLKHSMNVAARDRGVFHLWWHPHNFGLNINANLCFLESLLQHYEVLREKWGMTSARMCDFAKSADSNFRSVEH